MIPKYRQREFKLRLAAWIEIEWEASKIEAGRSYDASKRRTLIDCLLDADIKARTAKDSIWNYFSNEKAFRDFLRDNRVEIAEIRNDIANSVEESPFSEFSPTIDGGGREREGGSAHREMTSDAALKATDDDEFTVRTLEAFAGELGHKITDAIRAKIQRYAKILRIGRQ